MLNFYECEGQMSIFDLPTTQEEVTEVKCKHSGHVCNKENVWEVADTLDDKSASCPHICCRLCDVKGCGARCNGSDRFPSQNELIECFIQYLYKHCEYWKYDWIDEVKHKPTVKTFLNTVCKITKTHFFHVGNDVYGIEFSKKEETGRIYKCGKDEECCKTIHEVSIECIVNKIVEGEQ